MKAVILAGGLGTRLRSVISDIPKPMADINGLPFLEYLFRYLTKYNIDEVVLAVGYKHDVIENHFHDNYKDIKIVYSIEDEPLGTGGAIKKASKLLQDNNILIINGDTFFDIDLDKFYDNHIKSKSLISIASKEMFDFDRYGSLDINNNKVISFNEKKYLNKGIINGGIYIINKQIFDNIDLIKFSFEKEILEKNKNIYAFLFDGFFIDIGIPEDYLKAQLLLSQVVK